MPTGPIEDGRTPAFISALVVAIGLGLLFVSVSSGRSAYQLIADGSSAQGVVTKVNGAHLTVEFKSTNGDAFRYLQSGLIWGYRVGDRVQVLYTSSDPRGTACISAAGALWFPTGIMAFLGGSLFLGGLSQLRRKLQEKGGHS